MLFMCTVEFQPMLTLKSKKTTTSAREREKKFQEKKFLASSPFSFQFNFFFCTIHRSKQLRKQLNGVGSDLKALLNGTDRHTKGAWVAWAASEEVEWELKTAARSKKINAEKLYIWNEQQWRAEDRLDDVWKWFRDWLISVFFSLLFLSLIAPLPIVWSHFASVPLRCCSVS